MRLCSVLRAPCLVQPSGSLRPLLLPAVAAAACCRRRRSDRRSDRLVSDACGRFSLRDPCPCAILAAANIDEGGFINDVAFKLDAQAQAAGREARCKGQRLMDSLP